MSDTSTAGRACVLHIPPSRTSLFGWVPSDAAQLAAVEAGMLSHLQCSVRSRYVAGLNTLSSAVVEPTEDALPLVATPEYVASSGRRHIVFLHGFGGGLAMWLPNMEPVIHAASPNTFVHFIDLPGFARSERHAGLHFRDHVDAMTYMTQSLLRWFEGMGLNADGEGSSPLSIDLVGHSFGGYVAASFAERYPRLVNRLVLCDPWGVPPLDPEVEKKMSGCRRLLVKVFYAVNPFSILRAAGPWGPKLLPSVRKDFAARWAPIIGDPSIFFDYVYHCNASSSAATGAAAFQACCVGPGFASRPLSVFLHTLPAHIHVSFIYGARTWMDKRAGFETCARTQSSRGPGVSCRYTEVPKAGHQLNTDNVSGFNVVLLKELGLTRE